MKPEPAKFKHFRNRPKRLTAKFVKDEYAKLLAKQKKADLDNRADGWLELFEKWNELKSYIGSEGSRIGYRFSQDMSNKKAEADDKYFREKIGPAVSKPEHFLTKALLSSRHKQAVAKRYGQQLLVDYEISLKPMDPINTKLRVQSSNICADYEKLIAQAKIKYKNKELNLSKARSLLFSDDEKTRREVYEKIAQWVLSNRDKLASYYSQLVKLRAQMANNLDYDSYVQSAYEMRGRTDYGRSDVEDFRRLILKYVAPVYQKYAARQAKNLGAPSLRPWDLNYDPTTSLPLGIVPVENQLSQSQQLFNKLSPRLGKHFQRMVNENLIDLPTRPNKQAGAYCTSFEDEGKVLIFCNSTGDAEDIRVLTHEMGHAFQGWESQHIEAVELQWGTAELAEVFSMGMEFLSMPYIDEFFPEEEAAKFATHRWAESLFTLLYVAVVDEFQHWIYDNPQATSNQRDDKWQEIYGRYLGAVDFSGIEDYKKTRWYLQSHIFTIPFYYIDYALAEICAMQLALLASKDHSKALDVFLKMAKLGGTRSFIQAVEYGGMRSPFEEKLMAELMDYVSKEIKL